MITSRATRLVRVADLQAFREAVLALALDGPPIEARDRILVVPTRAAAAHLVRTIEHRLVGTRGAVVLPDFVTPAELVGRLAERLPGERSVLADADREALLGVACRAACDAGLEPPFRLRPGLVAEILRFYDALRLNQKDVDAFERLALGMLEAGASYDRGAERLVRQTRFLVAAFREFQRRCAAVGHDEHELRRALVSTAAERPYRHLVVTVGDRAFDPHGITPADWDLMSRIPGVQRLEVVITDATLAGAQHERIHQLLPGIEEIRFEARSPSRSPLLLLPPRGGAQGALRRSPPEPSAGAAGKSLVHVARDREEEVAGFARRVKHASRCGELDALERVAIVVHQPLPYVYVAREVLRSGGIPCQMFDALPLAAEPYAAAVDVVFSAVSAGFARRPSLELLRSPHLRFGALSGRDVAAFDRALSEAGYLGDPDALEQLIETWRRAEPAKGFLLRARRAGEVLRALARELAPLRAPAPVADHLAVLLAFLRRYEHLPGPDDPWRERQLRARGAILGTLERLREAYHRFDPAPVEFDEAAAMVRRWIEGQTFAPRAGDAGVHLVDAESARFGEFDEVQLAGLVEGEWPDRPRRNIFYSPAVLRELGWAAEADRLAGARAAFVDLLRLPAVRLVVSTFTLENDALVTPSPLIDELHAAALDGTEMPPLVTRIFEDEALAIDPITPQALVSPAREWAERRTTMPPSDAPRFRGATSGHAALAWSVSGLERYQDCPFKFFAGDVLRLQEAPEDEAALSPRARGRFIHEVFQRFFEAWDAQGDGTITSDRFDEARALFGRVAEPLLARLPDADAALERTRLFGSAISVGIVDVVLGLEASRPVEVRARLLEHELAGHFALGASDSRVSLKGVADRIDLLAGNRLRVLDYKSGSAPNPKRALQVAVYAVCAQERLTAQDGAPWVVDEAAYVAFSGKRALVPVVKAGAADGAEALVSASQRLFDAIGGIGRGEFPPKPHDPIICRYCAYASVCRKDYVGDD